MRSKNEDIHPGQRAIQMKEITAVEDEVDAMRLDAMHRLQGLLDRLVGRRGETIDDNKQIASKVDSLARRIGVHLICKEEPATVRFHTRVFEARTPGSIRTITSSADFPSFTTRLRELSLGKDRRR